jgi:hypothetical protein
MIRAEFINSNITDSRFVGAHLLGSMICDSVITTTTFDGANLTGAAVSDNQEIATTWNDTIGRPSVGEENITNMFFAIIDRLLIMRLDVNEVAKVTNIDLVASTETPDFRFYQSSKALLATTDVTFAKVELRQSKSDPSKALFIGDLAVEKCVSRTAVIKRYPTHEPVPSNPSSTESEMYLAVIMNGAKISFGFRQDYIDWVASVVIDHTY